MNVTLTRLHNYRRIVNECKGTAHGIGIVAFPDKHLDFTAQTVEATAALLVKFIDRLIIEYTLSTEPSPPAPSE